MVATPTAPPGKSAPGWNWLNEADHARLLRAIPPGPAPGSEQDRKDFAEILKMETARTAADIAEARADEHFRLEDVSEVLGPGFTPQNYPVTFALLERARQDESLLVSELKKANRRPRPYQAHPEVKRLFEVSDYSYPSGHAGGSAIYAYLLAGLFPAEKEALLARAAAVAHSRVMAGVHYPSDVEEGRKLALALDEALLANPAFERDWAAAQAEIARRPLSPSAAAGSR